jgi:hypothetical protein
MRLAVLLMHSTHVPFEHPNRGVTSIRVEGRAGVPAVVGVRGPRGSDVGLFMDKDADARGCCNADRVVEIEVAIESGPRRKLGIDMGTAQQVESECRALGTRRSHKWAARLCRCMLQEQRPAMK